MIQKADRMIESSKFIKYSLLVFFQQQWIKNKNQSFIPQGSRDKFRSKANRFFFLHCLCAILNLFCILFLIAELSFFYLLQYFGLKEAFFFNSLYFYLSLLFLLFFFFFFMVRLKRPIDQKVVLNIVEPIVLFQFLLMSPLQLFLRLPFSKELDYISLAQILEPSRQNQFIIILIANCDLLVFPPLLKMVCTFESRDLNRSIFIHFLLEQLPIDFFLFLSLLLLQLLCCHLWSLLLHFLIQLRDHFLFVLLPFLHSPTCPAFDVLFFLFMRSLLSGFSPAFLLACLPVESHRTLRNFSIIKQDSFLSH